MNYRRFRPKLRSGFEDKIKDDLEARGVEYLYESLSLEYTVERKYKPDFYLMPSGVIVEAKGYFSSADRSKLLKVKEQNPDIEIRLLFQRSNNKLNKASKTTYAMWSDKHGFKWAEGVVPQEWIDE